MNITKIASGLIQKNSLNEQFRLCSIGCGDGKFDAAVVKGISDRFPHINMHYTGKVVCTCSFHYYVLVYMILGIDLNASCLQLAQTKLSSLNNISVTVMEYDIQTMSTDGIEPFDMIVTVNTLYYISSLGLALNSARNLLKKNGKYN